MLTKDALEKAYGVPHVLLKDGEEYTRKHLQDVSEAIKDFHDRTQQ